MKTKFVPVFVLTVALAALVGTAGYAFANGTGSMGFGQMHRGAFAMMGSGGKSTPWYTDGTGTVRDMAAARARAQRFADRIGLKTAEVMQFTNNFYVMLDDKAGHPATEVLVDPQTGAVTLEYGPAMMWNTRYGMMSGTSQGGMMGGSGMMGSGMMGGAAGGGMMGGDSGMMGSGMTGSSMMGGSGMMGRQGGNPTWAPSNVTGPVSALQARQLANRWLSQERPGATASEASAFPGYYTMDTSRDGKVEGMLSVNKQTGAVWYHWWHGRFVAMEE